MTDRDPDLIALANKLADLVAAQIELQHQQLAASRQASEADSARTGAYLAMIQPLLPRIMELAGLGAPPPAKPPRQNDRAPNGHVIAFPSPTQVSSSEADMPPPEPRS
jgi:hypothetical protein